MSYRISCLCLPQAKLVAVSGALDYRVCPGARSQSSEKLKMKTRPVAHPIAIDNAVPDEADGR